MEFNTRDEIKLVIASLPKDDQKMFMLESTNYLMSTPEEFDHFLKCFSNTKLIQKTLEKQLVKEKQWLEEYLRQNPKVLEKFKVKYHSQKTAK